MKIALVRYRYTPYGGAERYMSRLLAGLSEAGHDVHILASSWDGPRSEAIAFHQVRVWRKPGWLALLSFARGCRHIIERERFDVVFSLERTFRQDIYRAGDGCHRQWLTLKNRNKPLAGLLNWFSPVQRLTLAIERRLFCDPGLKAIIANSRQGKSDIISLYDVPQERIHVVYNGIDQVAMSEDERQRSRQEIGAEFGTDGELRLLYVGSGFKRKGVLAAIKAASLLTVPFRLFIVGKGQPGRYQRLARRLGIADRVVFTGPRKDVSRFYSGCDLFVFPTLYDPFSNATLEAMAHGLPVITSQYNGVAELIEPGVNGFVIDEPDDVGAIAACIMQLADAGQRKTIGQRAAATAAPFTMERNVRETLAVITKVSYSSTSGQVK